MADPFDDLTPEVAALFAEARATEPVTENPALFAAMAAAASAQPVVATARSRRGFTLGKVLTAKAAAIAGVLVLSGGVAAAATGTLPDPVQDVASDAADVVGVSIPHGKAVSDAAHDKSGTEDGSNHGKDVSTVARDNHGHNKDAEDDTTSTTTVDDKDHNGEGPGNNGKGNANGHDADDDNGDDDSVTTTTVAGPPASNSQGNNEKSEKSEKPEKPETPNNKGESNKGGKSSDDD